MVTYKNALVDVDGLFKTETDLAILVDFGLDNPIWLPKSQVEYDHQINDGVTVTLPEWLAVDKGIDHLVKTDGIFRRPPWI